MQSVHAMPEESKSQLNRAYVISIPEFSSKHKPKHLICFQSEASVFKFLWRSVDEFTDNWR